MVIWVKHFQTELMVEIYSKSLVRAIGKVLTHEIVCKQTAVWWSASRTLDNNNAVLTDL